MLAIKSGDAPAFWPEPPACLASFHVYDDAAYRDEEGVVLANWHAAQVEAIRVAGEIIADSAKSLKLGEDWRMEVTDDVGSVLFRLDFHIASSAAITRSRSAQNSTA